MKIESLFGKDRTVLSFEIFPPKRSKALGDIYQTLDILKGLNPDFISVTMGAGGSSVSQGTFDISKTIKNDFGIEPLVHLTCINSTKDEITSLLNSLGENGMTNILALRGDRNPDIAEKDEFKYASELITFIRSHGDFDISAACYPEGHVEAPDKNTDIQNLKKKVDSGASHLISQLFFDNNLFYTFLDKARSVGIGIPIEAGIMPVVNKGQVERMVSLCGASLPAKFKKMIDKYADRPEALRDAGIAYAMDQMVDLLSNGVDGLHLYTMNNQYIAKKICEGISSLI